MKSIIILSIEVLETLSTVHQYALKFNVRRFLHNLVSEKAACHSKNTHAFSALIIKLI